MKKIKLVFPFFKLLITNPGKILKSLFHLVNGETARNIVDKKYNLSKGLPELDILELFPSLNETVYPVTFLYGTSMPTDFVLLKLLAKSYNGNCDFFEIGSWRGESIAAVSSVCRSCTSLSLSNAEMESMGWGKKFQEVQRLFSKSLDNVTHYEGNSLRFDFSSLNKNFDLIFIDGDHSYHGVKNDTQKVLSLLKNDNSVIVWHDYAPNYEHINPEVFAGILDGMPVELHQFIYHVGNTYCAIFTRQQVIAKSRDYPMRPNKAFQVAVKAERLQSS